MAWPSNGSLLLASRRLAREVARLGPFIFRRRPQTLVLHDTSSSRWALGRPIHCRVCKKDPQINGMGFLDKSKAKQDPGPLMEHPARRMNGGHLPCRRLVVIAPLQHSLSTLPRGLIGLTSALCTAPSLEDSHMDAEPCRAIMEITHRTRVQHLVIPSLHCLAQHKSLWV